MSDTVDELVAGLFRSDARATARLITLVEDEAPEVARIQSAIRDRVGRAYRVGFTGPPGAGKSTLVAALAKHWVNDGESGRVARVSIVAVDPTSPFTGGALLGDRVRMTSLDPSVFIRSMANRGRLGGIAATTDGVCDVLDAYGSDWLLVETVGVGQSEVEIAECADVTVVVLTPGTGDSVQLLKAGLMEVAEIVVVNKADRPGADSLVAEIQSIVGMRPHSDVPMPIVSTVATENKGIDELAKTIEEYRTQQVSRGLLETRRKRNLRAKIQRLVEARLRREIWGGKGVSEELDATVECILRKEETPWDASERIVKKWIR
ncbi:MAG: methylmalonyl Co-A mutase-associated GTPase MeaB [Planctomycetes bacterium]|nr:methylmalonyl Co-A mutase-associated GTPase MeaB [Planctomycetota bacterium]